MCIVCALLALHLCSATSACALLLCSISMCLRITLRNNLLITCHLSLLFTIYARLR